MFSLLSRLFAWNKRTLPPSAAFNENATPIQAIQRLAALIPEAETLDAPARQALADAFHAGGLECLKSRHPGEAAFSLSHAADLGCNDDHLHYNLERFD